MNKDELSLHEKMGEILDLPLDMIKGYTRMTVIGDESILIENYQGIIEYENDYIRLHHQISIWGDSLNIDEITDDEMIVTGKIKRIEFE